MSKLKLLCTDSELPTFDQPWFRPVIAEHFELIYNEHNQTHSPLDTIVVTKLFGNDTWYKKYQEQGYKVLIDNLWEQPRPINNINTFAITNKNFFWYNESLWYSYLGYDAHSPCPAVTKNGLLLMNLARPHRTWLFDNLNLNNLLYSYVGRGIYLSNDISTNDQYWQRYFNPDWYNSTAFSIVAETTVHKDEPLFITEKTFKPIAFQHPFIVFGQPGVLKYLRKLGFETFENMFNEVYDVTFELDERMYNIAAQVNDYTYKPYDLLTIEKLRHNKELFFNKEIVVKRIKEEIIDKINEWANL